MTEEHGLVHALSNGNLVPACLCGWWSPDGSHWRFERHMRKIKKEQDDYN